ncbi:MAG TPA: peptidylprolyl isomerase [Xanthobacteraceae bacterium]|nr:peptidylprolyl isomerase [Xanthobacteraceae bacterium]
MTSNSHQPRSGCASISPYVARLGAAAALALLLAGTACSKQSGNGSGQTMSGATSHSTGAVVAKMNGVEIREGDLAAADEDFGKRLPAMSPDAKRDYLINFVGDMILLTQAAEAKKIDQQPAFAQQLEFARKQLLIKALLDEETKAAVTDASLHKFYDDAVKEAKPEEEVHARHILVPTEQEAKAIRSELDKGADFAELAKQKSKDPGTAIQGGDVGYFTKDLMVPEFSEAAFKLQKGQISAPVKTTFGWHIIKVEDRRMKQVPGFDQVRGEIANILAAKARQDYVAKLHETAKLERLDKPAEQPSAPAQDSQAAPPAASPAQPQK